jgi:hypothetical protein
LKLLVRGDVHSGFGWRNPKENYYLENLGADRRVMYKRVRKTVDGKLRNGLICPRIRKILAVIFCIYRAHRNLLTSCGKIGFKEGFFCIKLSGKFD